MPRRRPGRSEWIPGRSRTSVTRGHPIDAFRPRLPRSGPRRRPRRTRPLSAPPAFTPPRLFAPPGTFLDSRDHAYFTTYGRRSGPIFRDSAVCCRRRQTVPSARSAECAVLVGGFGPPRAGRPPWAGALPGRASGGRGEWPAGVGRCISGPPRQPRGPRGDRPRGNDRRPRVVAPLTAPAAPGGSTGRPGRVTTGKGALDAPGPRHLLSGLPSTCLPRVSACPLHG